MTKFTWRPLQHGDLAQLDAIARRVHAEFPEDLPVLAEKLALYPAGCFALASDAELAGYLLSHPWRGVPKLNTQLGAIPPDADAYYIHDLALLPEARGMRAGARIVERLVEQKSREGFTRMALVSVSGSVPFWMQLGFTVAANQVAGYGDDARYMVRPIHGSDV
ncbi:MAG: uncharacterized protein JWM77_2659 [Rhodospirillales bacterium]|nr:uncharacterized protein [Rhodospirillales bacterium]